MAGDVTTVKVGSFEINTSLRRDASGRAGTGPDDLKYAIPDDFVLLADLLEAIREAIEKPDSFIRVNVDSANTIVSVERLEGADTPLEVALEVIPPAAVPKPRRARTGKAPARK